MAKKAAPQRRASDKAIVESGLEKRVHDLKNVVVSLGGSVESLAEQVSNLATVEQVDREFERERRVTWDAMEKRQKDTESKLTRRTIAGVLLGFVLAALLGVGFADGARIEGCHARNDLSRALRDVVDRSLTAQGNLDLTKLSPEAKRILAEFAAAQPPQGDPQSFRSFVYRKAAIRDCSIIP